MLGGELLVGGEQIIMTFCSQANSPAALIENH
jgi:hypothetical protein